ncbi:uncharacterized protein LOC128395855 [Panonychus citri]|uniref:uncharacterized protein LOC128395855 n=1 Tax=Panonychus citri TaxID=50023 RepID=UPI0023073861|nr:uncharacterized protein LOC128395855 [Panonychus citri]
MDLQKLNDKRLSNKSKFNIVKSYFERNHENNLNKETTLAEITAYPIVKYLQLAVKDNVFIGTLKDEELLLIIKFIERLIDIREAEAVPTNEDSEIHVQDLSNNQIKNLLSVQFDVKHNRPKTWFSVEHLTIHHTIIIRIPGTKNKNDQRIGNIVTEQVENLLEEANDDIGSAEEVVPGFDSAKIRCSNVAERKKIFSYISKQKPEWEAKIPPISDPQVKIIDVKFSTEQSEQWIERLIIKNRWKKCWKIQIKHAYRSGNYYDVIIEIDPALREWFEKTNGQISVGYKKAKVVDHFDIRQCQRCTKFGHLSNRCSQIGICPYCGEKNHIHEECSIKNDQNKWRCPNCKKMGHNAWDKNCSFFQERLLYELERKNYQYKIIMA